MQARTAVVALLLVSMTAATATAGTNARVTPSTVSEPIAQTDATVGGDALPSIGPLVASTASVRDPAGGRPGYGRGGGARQIGPTPVPAGGSTIEPVRTNMTIRLEPDGDAEWTITVAVGLSGPNETRAFRELADRYTTGRAEVGPSIEPFERALAAASRGIEREMALVERSRSTRIEDGTGYLTLRFVWTDFAEAKEGRLRVGDAFRTPEGTWLPGLAANQTLTILGPPGYGVSSAPIGPSRGALRWDGPLEFESTPLTITYRRGLRNTATRTTVPTAETGVDLAPLAGLAVLAVGLAIALYVRSRGLVAPGRGDEEGTGSPAGSDGPNAPDGTESGAPDAPSGATSSGAADGAVDGDSATGARNAAIDAELLSDEERVERLLNANGGRMRQADIVTETRWSNAKVSQLLSAMDRNGRIEKLRIGRENLISLSETDSGDPDAGSDAGE